MNDSDNHNITNHQTDNSAATYTRHDRIKRRTSDIYERFLDRVQQIEEDAARSDMSDKPSSYEPLSDEELRLFTDFEQYDDDEKDSTAISSQHIEATKVSQAALDITNDDRNDTAAVIIDGLESDADNIKVDNLPHELTDHNAIDKKAAKKAAKVKKSGAVRGKQVSNVKILIVGVICGLLLSAAMVVILNSTGVLAALTDRLSATSNGAAKSTSAPKDNTASPEPATNQNPVVAVQVVDNTNINDEKTMTTESVAPTTEPSKNSNPHPQQAATPPNANSSNDADLDITYEDFRKEAQSTLYRESKD